MNEIYKRKPESWLAKLLMNDQIILLIIVINAIVIFIEESGIHNYFLMSVDQLCTMIFLMEMIVKHVFWGIKGYWSSAWNRLDGFLVILSVPQLVLVFFSNIHFDLSIILIFRLFRILRVFRLVRFFPNFTTLMSNMRLAMTQTRAIFLAFFVIILVFGLINCVIFRRLAPQYFSTPMISLYSVFRLCTVEGWYEIPDAISAVTSPFWGSVTRIYFSLFLLLGGIIGMSFINSIFVDAMVSDNNDDVKAQLKEMEKKIDRLIEENEKLKEGRS